MRKGPAGLGGGTADEEGRSWHDCMKGRQEETAFRRLRPERQEEFEHASGLLMSTDARL